LRGNRFVQVAMHEHDPVLFAGRQVRQQMRDDCSRAAFSCSKYPARIVGVGGSPPRLDAGGAAVRLKTGTEGGAGG
jgi:hypothetical protein